MQTCSTPRWLLPGLLGLALLLGTAAARAAARMETLPYGGWSNCVRLTNGQLELIATTDVGPRVLRLARPGGTNLFREWPDQLGKTGGKEFRIYGGHRLWHAPEVLPRTYAPDNEPVKVDWNGQRLRLTAPVEAATGLQKEMEIALSPEAPTASVTHRLYNRGVWDVEAAPWALTVFAGPGRAIVPQEPHVAHGAKVLPVRTLTLWAYTDMQDPRYTWGRRFVQVRSDPAARTSQKVGFRNTTGWAAFARDGEVFIKRFAFDPGAVYADLGSNTEVYTSGDMLELETLGPLRKIAPGASVDHVEQWQVFPAELGDTDEALAAVLPALADRVPKVNP